MKIGLDVSQTCGQMEGCAWVAKQVAEAIIEKGKTDTKIALYHHFGRRANMDPQSGYQNSNKNTSSPLLRFSRDEAREIWAQVENGKSQLPGNPDIIHSHNFSAPNIAKCPLVFTVHDLAFWDVPETTTETNRLICQEGILKALHTASAFTFPSEYSKNRFEDFFGKIIQKNNQRLKVIPWAGRFEQAKSPKQYTADSPFLFVGSFEPRKNIRNLLTAFEIYYERSKQPRKLLIAGGAGWRSDFEKDHLISLERRGWAKSLGYVNEPTLLTLYQTSFALLWPSLYEGFGLPLVEAMSQGTPVITSKLTSLPEVAGSAGIYCNPNDPENIAQRMLDLENDPENYSTISKTSLTQASIFSWKKTAQMLLDFYSEIMMECKNH